MSGTTAFMRNPSLRDIGDSTNSAHLLLRDKCRYSAALCKERLSSANRKSFWDLTDCVHAGIEYSLSHKAGCLLGPLQQLYGYLPCSQNGHQQLCIDMRRYCPAIASPVLSIARSTSTCFHLPTSARFPPCRHAALGDLLSLSY